jgi:hypothetical protein
MPVTRESATMDSMERYDPFEFVLRFRALEFAQGRPAFEERLYVRLKHGATGHRISQRVGGTESFEVVIGFVSLGGARGFAEEVSRLELQRQAGVVGGAHHHTHRDQRILKTLESVWYDV